MVSLVHRYCGLVVVYGYIHWTTNRSLHTGRRSSTAANRSTIKSSIRSSRPRLETHPTHECRSTAAAPIDAEQRRAESHIAAFKKHEQNQARLNIRTSFLRKESDRRRRRWLSVWRIGHPPPMWGPKPQAASSQLKGPEATIPARCFSRQCDRDLAHAKSAHVVGVVERDKRPVFGPSVERLRDRDVDGPRVLDRPVQRVAARGT